jgi:hypothetical protein
LTLVPWPAEMNLKPKLVVIVTVLLPMEAAVLANISAALRAGQHIAGLAGIVKPTRAIGAVHRAVLVDPAGSNGTEGQFFSRD